MTETKKKPFLLQTGRLLIFGSVVALLWANFAPHYYHEFLETVLFPGGPLNHGHGITVHYLITDLMMAFFFVIPGKEIREAILPGGPLASPKQALLPTMGTLGGVLGPVGMYFLVAAILGRMAMLSAGWAIPMATDIAFSYMIGLFVFGKKHPAVAFLLTLAIMDDAIGMIVIAVVFTSSIHIWWLVICLAIAITMSLVMRKYLVGHKLERSLGIPAYAWYIVPALISWVGFAMSGVHPSLAFLPVVFCMPHAGTDLGIYTDAERKLTDPLNRMEHALETPAEVILGLFALVSAGVEFTAFGISFWPVVVGLLVGKPVFIWLFSTLASKVLRQKLGFSNRSTFVIGCAASIGFTVSLFMAQLALSGDLLAGAKLGALASIIGILDTYIFAKILKVGRFGNDFQQDGYDGHGKQMHMYVLHDGESQVVA